MEKSAKYAASILCIVFIAYFFSPIWLFGERDISFLTSIEEEFEESGQGLIPIKDVVDFDWDLVCFIHPYMSYSISNFGEKKAKKDIESWGGNYEVIKKHLPLKFPSSVGFFLFFKGDKIVQKFSYGGRAFGFGLVNYTPTLRSVTISVNGEKYGFAEEHSSENDFCITIENAAFVRKIDKNRGFKKVLITNKDKRKN